MTPAQNIARSITEAAEDCMGNRISVEECSRRTKALWDAARGLKLEKQVSEILQAESLQEMTEALAAMGVK